MVRVLRKKMQDFPVTLWENFFFYEILTYLEIEDERK